MATRDSMEPAELVRDSSEELAAPLPARAHITLSRSGSMMMLAALNNRRHVVAPEGLKKLVRRMRKYESVK